MERKGHRLLRVLITERRLGIVCACLAVWCWSVVPTQALVIQGGAGTSTPAAHTTRPTTDPGWDNVGWGSNGTAASSPGSAIYLGNRWVLTAGHTIGNQITLGDTFGSGTLYTKDPATASVRLKNPDGSDTDLVMFRIQQDPGLATLDIIQNTPGIGDSVVMIGTGVERGSALTTYPSGHQGYDWSGSRLKTWGDNTVAQESPGNSGFVFNVAGIGLDVSGFGTVFDNSTGEGQAAAKDSGGAVFVDVTGNGDWQLGGVMIAVSTFGNQPDGPLGVGQTSVFGNATLMADLSVYRDQIVSLIPEPSSAAVLGVFGMVLIRRRSRRLYFYHSGERKA